MRYDRNLGRDLCVHCRVVRCSLFLLSLLSLFSFVLSLSTSVPFPSVFAFFFCAARFSSLCAALESHHCTPLHLFCRRDQSVYYTQHHRLYFTSPFFTRLFFFYLLSPFLSHSLIHTILLFFTPGDLGFILYNLSFEMAPL